MTQPLDTSTIPTQPADASSARPPSQKSKSEAVIVCFEYRKGDWQSYFTLEEELGKAVEDAGIGECDGNELSWSGREGSIYFYGPDANAILALIAPRLRAARFLARVAVTLRYAR